MIGGKLAHLTDHAGPGGTTRRVRVSFFLILRAARGRGVFSPVLRGSKPAPVHSQRREGRMGIHTHGTQDVGQARRAAAMSPTIGERACVCVYTYICMYACGRRLQPVHWHPPRGRDGLKKVWLSSSKYVDRVRGQAGWGIEMGGPARLAPSGRREERKKNARQGRTRQAMGSYDTLCM